MLTDQKQQTLLAAMQNIVDTVNSKGVAQLVMAAAAPQSIEKLNALCKFINDKVKDKPELAQGVVISIKLINEYCKEDKDCKEFVDKEVEGLIVGVVRTDLINNTAEQVAVPAQEMSNDCIIV